MTAALPKVVIVGAGFGGLRAARALAHAPVQVTLIDRNNYHLFQPLLYQVATSGISPEEIAHPVRGILRRQRNFEFRLAEVNGINLAARRLSTSTGEVSFDYLILAVGGVTHFFNLGSIAPHSFGLKSLSDATALRSHLLRMFELAAQEQDPIQRQAMLTFVIVGGGPTGVESSGAISELIRMVLARDFPRLDFSEVRVVLLEAADRLLPAMPPDLSAVTAQTLTAKHVEVRFNTAVTGYDGMQVTIQNANAISARTLIWAAGVRAAPLVNQLGAPQGSLGRVKVKPTLQVPDHPEVFVIGDAAYLENGGGKPLPMVAPVAMQQAKIAAHNIAHLLAGTTLQEFKYKDPGALATIGRNAAVAHLGRWKFTGFFAWMVWLVVHLMQLVGFRNRLIVLINWAWDYLFYERAVRLITHAQSDTMIVPTPAQVMDGVRK